MLVWYTVYAKSQEVVALDFLRSGKIKCLANRYLRLAFFIIAYAIAKLILATDIASINDNGILTFPEFSFIH